MTWINLTEASQILGISIRTLRQNLATQARKQPRRPGEVLEVQLDGIRARKLGRTWRVSLESWQDSVNLSGAVEGSSSGSEKNEHDD